MAVLSSGYAPPEPGMPSPEVCAVLLNNTIGATNGNGLNAAQTDETIVVLTDVAPGAQTDAVNHGMNVNVTWNEGRGPA